MITSPQATHHCPLCGQPNACAAARTRSFDTPCWCMSSHFPPELLARVPAELRGLACICRTCADEHAAAAAGRPPTGGA